jgi:hypothetical protein
MHGFCKMSSDAAIAEDESTGHCPPDGNLLPPPEEWDNIERRIEERLGLNRTPKGLNSKL